MSKLLWEREEDSPFSVNLEVRWERQNNEGASVDYYHATACIGRNASRPPDGIGLKPMHQLGVGRPCDWMRELQHVNERR